MQVQMNFNTCREPLAPAISSVMSRSPSSTSLLFVQVQFVARNHVPTYRCVCCFPARMRTFWIVLHGKKPNMTSFAATT